jgi:uncharacterized protein with NRDE domain
MCLIAFAWGASERFPLVIAANRDEFYERPTAPLANWTTPNGTSIIGGRDLRDGGTWMAFAQNGRFAMLTNVRQPQQDGALGDAAPRISRGGLVVAWLESDLAAETWVKHIDSQRYQGFNLIVGDWQSKQCNYVTNQSIFKPFRAFGQAGRARGAIELEANPMPWGAVYGQSNAALDTPWPKTRALKEALSSALDCEDLEGLTQRCWEALANPNPFAAEDLPQTGVSPELQLALSSVFVRHPQAEPEYGTRTSLVAVYQRGKGLQVSERTYGITEPAATSMAHASLWL